MNFLDRMILDNTVRNYLFVFSVIAIVFIFKRLLSHSLASLLYLFVKRKWKSVGRDRFIALTLKPLSWFVVIMVIVFTLDNLVFPAAWSFEIRKTNTKVLFEKAGITAIIISFFYFAVSFINFIALLLEENANTAKDKSHGQVVLFFRDLLKVVVAIIGVLFVIKIAFDQNIGSLLTGLSIVGAALALAAKESIENLIASFIIFFDKPFFTGDTLKVNNVTGTVEHIGLRSTRIRTPEKTLVTVPNKQMVDSVVDNWSMRIQRRAEIKLLLSEKSRPETVQQFIERVKSLLETKQEEIVKSSVFLANYSKDGLEILIEYFTPPFSRGEFDKEKQKINFLLMKLMTEHQLEMSSSAGSINIINDGVVMPKQDSIV